MVLVINHFTLNRSTSSSAGEDVSAALSSGKSGNSLNSSVDDSAESGLGTASSIHGSAYRKIRPYLHQISQKSIDDKNTWIRYENATTQTGRMRPSLKLIENASFVSTDDPDLLEVLSLYDDNNAEDDGFALSDSEASSKFQDESDQSIRRVPEVCEEEDVVLRRKGSAPQVKCLDRLIMSYSPSAPCKIINNTSVVPENQCNSLPLTRRVTKEKHLPTINGENVSDSSLPTIPRRPFCLPMSQESFHNISQLPSPSTTSLHSGGNRRSALLVQELTTKSNSAPLLMKKEHKRDAFTDNTAVSDQITQSLLLRIKPLLTDELNSQFCLYVLEIDLYHYHLNLHTPIWDYTIIFQCCNLHLDRLQVLTLEQTRKLLDCVHQNRIIALKWIIIIFND